MSKSKSNHCTESCFVETHTVSGSGVNESGNIPLGFRVPANTTNTPIFRDFTNNHNKTLLQLGTSSTDISGAVPLTITIQLRGSTNPIIDTIGAGETRVYQVEDFESLTVTNPNPNTNGQLDAFIQKTFCICCNCKSKKNED